MRKKYLLITLALSLSTLTLNGCSSKNSSISSNEANITDSNEISTSEFDSKESVTANTNKEESSSTDTSLTNQANEPTTEEPQSEVQAFLSTEEFSPDTAIKPEELKLGIDTIEKRKAAIEELGAEVYWIGTLTSCNYIQTQSCSDSPLTNTIEEAYPDYKASVVQLTSDYDGHMIPADYVLSDEIEDNDTIIFIHGASENRRNFNDVCKLYLDLGYNILAYDQRSSGENEVPYCTYGYLEQYDLKQYINFVKEKLSSDKKLLIYARSQGGVTACRVLGSEFGNESIDGAILDCPLSSMRQIIEPYCVNYIKPEDVDYYFECGDQVLSHFIDGFTMAGSEMTEYIKDSTVPTLVLTSKGDTVVDMKMPISIYDAIPGTNKQLYISESAYHCWIQVMEPEIYHSTVTEFLKNFDLGFDIDKQ